MYRVIHLNLQVQKNEKYPFLREVHQSGEIENVALPPSGAAQSQVDQGERRGYHKMKL